MENINYDNAEIPDLLMITHIDPKSESVMRISVGWLQSETDNHVVLQMEWTTDADNGRQDKWTPSQIDHAYIFKSYIVGVQTLRPGKTLTGENADTKKRHLIISAKLEKLYGDKI